jgi:ABC-type transport system involved in multi-copper enzyme maturation permease subunit
MRPRDYILLALACVAVVAFFYAVVTVAAFASATFGPWAGVLFITAVCVVALLILAIIKNETDGMDRP